MFSRHGFIRHAAIYLILGAALPCADGWSADGPEAPQKAPLPAKDAESVPPTRELLLAGRIHFSAPPPELIDTSVKCDLRGNMYLIYSGDPRGVAGSPAGMSGLPVQRLSLDSQAIQQYVVPQITDYQAQSRVDFDVTPWGTVYCLIGAFHHWPRQQGERPDYLIVQFKDDGTVDSTVNLQQPPGGFLDASLIAAFPRGGFLVTGTFTSDLSILDVRAFTGIYGKSGRLQREVETSEGPTKVSPPTATEGGAAKKADAEERTPSTSESVSMGKLLGGTDGNIYLLRATSSPRLYVISPAGEVLRQVEVHLGRSGLTPVGMTLAEEGGALIEFGHFPTRQDKDRDSRILIALIDLETGEVRSLLQLPADQHIPETGCSTERGEMVFLGTSEKGQLDLLRFVVH